MKHYHLHINKSSLLAVLFFGIMTAIGCNAANAQDSINPLISTTGPNVLGSGHIQWNSNIEWFHFDLQTENSSMRSNILGANTEVRFGVGSKAELTVGLGGNHALHHITYIHMDGEEPIEADPNNMSFAPSVGAKLLLFEGKGWLPQVAFSTNIALASTSNQTLQPHNYTAVQPTIGLSFRNSLGKRWMLDYSLGMTWNKCYPINTSQVLSGSLYARWLATDRLMLGAGFSSGNWGEPFCGDFEVRYLANPNLQLTLQGSFSGGIETESSLGTTQAHLLTGVSWTIR